MSLLVLFNPPSGGPGSITGTLSATESPDSASVEGTRGPTGTFTATGAQDSASLSGTVTAGGTTISGTLAATEAQDSATFGGAPQFSGGSFPAPKPAKKTKKLVAVMAAREAPDGAVLYGYTVERYAKARIDDEFLMMVA